MGHQSVGTPASEEKTRTLGGSQCFDGAVPFCLQIAGVSQKTVHMKCLFTLIIFGASIILMMAAQDYPVKPVPFTKVKVEDAFWSPRIETNRVRTVWYDFEKCEETGRIDNFAKAGKLMEGDFRGTPFDDSDVFKVIEGAAYTLALHPDPKLDAYLDELIRKIAAAQESDGYLYTARTISPQGRVDFFGPTRWSNLRVSHELYNVGHLYEAAVAHFSATGKRSLLEVALKNADLICQTFGPGEDQLKEPPGHQEIEMGLVKLFRTTGERKYLDQAKFFCDIRGRADTHKLRGLYQQDDKPIVEQDEAVGHAVRAGYFYSGVADVAALTGETKWIEAIDRIWENVVGKKMHLTGGIGATRTGEAFGENYYLPNRSAYLETCAAIANAFWNHRMFLLHGDAKYMDVLERAIYNGFLSGISMTGDRFFYPNPLESDGVSKFNQGSNERAPWFGCSCCPVNVVRFIPGIAEYIYATRGEEVFVNLFIGSTAEIELAGRSLSVRQVTGYPWNGKVRLEIGGGAPGAFKLNVRVPGWAVDRPVPSDLYLYENAGASSLPAGFEPKLNGRALRVAELVSGYVTIERTWRAGDTLEFEFPMPVRRVQAHPRAQANTGRFALERGPLVYCAEGADNGGRVLDRVFPGPVRLETRARPDLLGGITLIRMIEDSGEPLTLIPYYAWCHRGPNEMRVWFPTEPERALASHCNPSDSVEACFDGREPANSADSSIPRFTWWDHKGGREWVIQTFETPREVSRSAVYWFDDTGKGACRVPKSWRLLYDANGQWKPVEALNDYGTATDRYNEVEFRPVTTSALRLEAELQDNFSAGVLEWKTK
jgi:uncharacterized protein